MVGVERRVSKQMIDSHVLSPVWKRSNNADRVAWLPAAPALLFRMRQVPNRRVHNARRANGSKRLIVNARFSIADRPPRSSQIDQRDRRTARVGSGAAKTPPFPATCASLIHYG